MRYHCEEFQNPPWRRSGNAITSTSLIRKAQDPKAHRITHQPLLTNCFPNLEFEQTLTLHAPANRALNTAYHQLKTPKTKSNNPSGFSPLVVPEVLACTRIPSSSFIDSFAKACRAASARTA